MYTSSCAINNFNSIDHAVPAVSLSETTTTAEATVNVGAVVGAIVGGVVAVVFGVIIIIIIVVVAIVGIVLCTRLSKQRSVDLLEGADSTER